MCREVARYVFLGFIQGLTEVLPISSAGHLALSDALFNLDTVSMNLALFLHLGTFLAIFIYFARDVRDLLAVFLRSWKILLFPRAGQARNPFRRRDTRVPWYLLGSTVVTGIIGYSLQETVSATFHTQSWAITLLLLLNGLLIIATSQRTIGHKTMAEIGLRDYFLIGLAQGLAVFPGLSRLGLTLCMGLVRKMNWFEALKLSFILSLPTIAGGVILRAPTMWYTPTTETWLGIALGIAAATGGGLIAVRFLMNNVLERHSLVAFGVYCILAGTFFTILFLTFPQVRVQAKALLNSLPGGI